MLVSGICKSCEADSWIDALTNLCRDCEIEEGKRWGHRDVPIER